jgi:MFS family permease
LRIGRFELRAVENTRWDYILPLGLSGVEALLLIFWAVLIDVVEKEKAEMWGSMYRVDWAGWALFLGSILGAFVLLFLITKYLTRLQRIIALPILGLLGIFSGKLLWEAFYLLVGVPLYGIGYMLGTLAVYVWHGNNPSQRRPEKPYLDVLQYAILFGVVGGIIGAVAPVLAVGGLFPTTLVFPVVLLRVINLLPTAVRAQLTAMIMNHPNPLLSNIALWALVFAFIGGMIAGVKALRK